MNKQELTEYVNENLPDWVVNEQKLHCDIKTENWTQSMLITNMISYLAENFDHHPNLTIKYSSVTIDLFTHSENSISEKDLHLARKISELLSINK